jgi:hypothetical protein
VTRARRLRLQLALVAASLFGCTLLVGCPDKESASGNSRAGGDSPSANEMPASKPLFADAIKDVGIDFVHEAPAGQTPYAMHRHLGSGAAVLDFDGDGRLDLYFLQNGGDAAKTTCRLYRQTDGGKFVDVSQGSGLDIKALGMGAAIGDANNDGKVDVVVTEYRRTRIFINRATGDRPQFVDITKDAGIDNVFWGTSCGFVDFDRDGWLDLVVVNYVDYDPSRWCDGGSGWQDFCGPDNFAGRIAKLYRNVSGEPNADLAVANERPIRFRDVTTASGLSKAPGPGLGVFCADFSGDRWPDIFVTNDGKPNHLWINQRNGTQRNGTFVEDALTNGVATNAMGKDEANMGIAVGDVDGNGLFDLFVTHLTTETHTLWMQDIRGFSRWPAASPPPGAAPALAR